MGAETRTLWRSCYILADSSASSGCDSQAKNFSPMIDDPVLLNDWHAVAWASQIRDNQPAPIRLLENELVLWRNRDGLHAWRDLCVHRGSRLFVGRVTKC